MRATARAGDPALPENRVGDLLPAQGARNASQLSEQVMKEDANENATVAEAEGRSYAAPALEKGLDILETLCRSEQPLSQKDIAQRLGRSVGEIYRMVACLVNRNYVTLVDENTYGITTKLFELAHINPPTHRLLFEATPIMQRLAGELDQSCHLTVYGQGKQVVLFKVDTPSGMGFAVRAGAELDVLISASGRVLLAFQDDETRKLRIEESLQRRPEQADPQMERVLESIRTVGYESIPSVQVRGLYAVSFPVLDAQGRAIAALTVPYAERIDQIQRKSIPEVTDALGRSARTLSARIGGMVSASGLTVTEREEQQRRTGRPGIR
jgi:DNA-binding IclR family transcriptional regulator